MQTLILGEGKQKKCVNFASSFTHLPSLPEGNSAEPWLPGAALLVPVNASLRCSSFSLFLQNTGQWKMPFIRKENEGLLFSFLGFIPTSRTDRASLCICRDLSLNAQV